MKAIKWAADQLGDLAGIRVLSDTMGACVLVDIDTSIYGQTSVMKTAYWYTDTHYVFIAHGDERSQLRVELRGKSESSSEELDILSREFCNRLLDQQIRESVASETEEVRDALVKKAFFEGSLHIDPSLLQSDETAVLDPETRNENISVSNPKDK